MNQKTPKIIYLASAVFAAFSLWWIGLHTFLHPNANILEWFSDTYGVMALVGAAAGILYSRLWGGFRSFVGRAMLMFAFGLLLQEFGQISYSAYTHLFHINIPYPSVGDIGYFGSIPVYIYGVWLLGRAVGARYSMKSFLSKAIAVIIPLAILITSYAFFLRGYQADWHQPIGVLLDFGYPLGQSIYIAMAILVFLFSRKYLGGLMRPVILSVLFALVVQYTADFMFLYQNKNNIWTTGGANDYTYLVSYFVMTVALIRFRTAYSRIGSAAPEEKTDG